MRSLAMQNAQRDFSNFLVLSSWTFAYGIRKNARSIVRINDRMDVSNRVMAVHLTL
jgi:hypothetical protein